jgi:glucosamine--fructose-6-phosphate aminotransferase (isomerizing)
MCGIVGFVGQVPEGCWGQTHRILESLLKHAEHRGKDATGFVARTVPLDYPDRAAIAFEKRPVAASEFVRSSGRFRGLEHRRCTSFIGHVRAATHGRPEDNRNNHPFVADDGSLYLVHNGILTNHRDVADNLSLDLTSDCDSEVLLRLVETAPEVAGGLQDCLKYVRGSMAIAAYERAADCVWLAHNGGRPLWLARMRQDRRWFFASTDSILLGAFRSVLGPAPAKRLDYLAPVPEGTPIALLADGRVIAEFDNH